MIKKEDLEGSFNKEMVQISFRKSDIMQSIFNPN